MANFEAHFAGFHPLQSDEDASPEALMLARSRAALSWGRLQGLIAHLEPGVAHVLAASLIHAQLCEALLQAGHAGAASRFDLWFSGLAATPTEGPHVFARPWGIADAILAELSLASWEPIAQVAQQLHKVTGSDHGIVGPADALSPREVIALAGQRTSLAARGNRPPPRLGCGIGRLRPHRTRPTAPRSSGRTEGFRAAARKTAALGDRSGGRPSHFHFHPRGDPPPLPRRAARRGAGAMALAARAGHSGGRRAHDLLAAAREAGGTGAGAPSPHDLCPRGPALEFTRARALWFAGRVRTTTPGPDRAPHGWAGSAGRRATVRAVRVPAHRGLPVR